MAEVVVNMGIADLNKELDKTKGAASSAAENLELSKKLPPAVAALKDTLSFMIHAIGNAKTGSDFKKEVESREAQVSKTEFTNR